MTHSGDKTSVSLIGNHGGKAQASGAWAKGRVYLGSKAFAVVSSAFICAAMILGVRRTAPLPQILFGRDLIYLLDEGWKWKWGIVSQTEYYSPIGSLTSLFVAFGMNIGGSMAKALPTAICGFAIALLPLALYVSFRRLHPLVAWVAVLVIMATALTPHMLCFGSEAWSYAASFIRWEYALFCIVLLIAMVAPSDRSRRNEAIDGVIAGFSTAFLTFLTMSGGLLAVAMLVVFAISKGRRLSYTAGAVGGAAGTAITIGSLLTWDVPSLVRGMSLEVSAWQGRGAEELILWARKLIPDLTILALLAGLWCISGVLSKSVRPFVRITEAGLVFVGLAVSALVMAASGAPLGNLRENPVLCIGALMLLSRILADVWSEGDPPTSELSQRRIVLVAGAAILTFFIVSPVTARNLRSIAQAAIWKFRAGALPSHQVFQRGPLQGLQIQYFGGDPPLPTSYVGRVMDGLALLARAGRFDKTVTCLDFSNPFNVARGVKPSRALPIAGPFSFVYSSNAAPPPEAVLDGEDVVLMPKLFGASAEQDLRNLQEHYRDYLEAHYARAGESQQWQLFVPKKMEPD